MRTPLRSHVHRGRRPTRARATEVAELSFRKHTVRLRQYSDGGQHWTEIKPRLLDLERRIPARDRFAPDSPLEQDGFELSVPRAVQGRPKAIIDGFGCMPPSLDSAAAVGGDQRRRAKAKSRNRSLIARGTGSSNPPPSNGQSVTRAAVPLMAAPTGLPSTAEEPSLIRSRRAKGPSDIGVQSSDNTQAAV